MPRLRQPGVDLIPPVEEPRHLAAAIPGNIGRGESGESNPQVRPDDLAGPGVGNRGERLEAGVDSHDDVDPGTEQGRRPAGARRKDAFGLASLLRRWLARRRGGAGREVVVR